MKMKSRLASFIMSLITTLMIVIFIFFGIIIYNEITKTNVASQVEEFVSNITISSGETNGNTKISEVLDIESNEEKINSDNTNYESYEGNNYFYDQLDENSKVIYDSLKSNRENMKTGTYEINLGTDFTELLSSNDGEELLGKYYQSAIEAYTYDNPDVFYIDFSKLYLNIETTTKGSKKTYRVFINSGDESNYLTNVFSSKERIDEGISQIEKIRTYFVQNKRESEYENIKLVHDYLVESIEYDQTISESNIYDIYGALINKKCVCEGYAKSFKYLMDALDIPCVMVAGRATNSDGNTENHAWNYVQLNKIWYAIDCTWDDPILVGGGFLSNASKYKYFLKGEKEFNESHIPVGKFTQNGKVFVYPNLNQSNY